MFSLQFANYILEVGHLVWELKHKYALAGITEAENFTPGSWNSIVRTLIHGKAWRCEGKWSMKVAVADRTRV